MTSASWFHGRVVVIATMHQKETVIAPILKQHLGVHIAIPSEFNTDQFGTFTRDIPRQGTQLEAAIAKAQAALDETGETLAIASEGTFGPHPVMPYLPFNRELVVLIDREKDLTIVGQATSTQTNYRYQVIDRVETAYEFAEKVGFPEHGLVVLPEGAIAHPETIFKGICTEAQLSKAVTEILAQGYTVRLETDMRAMHNPTRMAVIAEATRDLIQQIQSTCPKCDAPGFAIHDHRPGLPCDWCQQPTTLTLAVIRQCQTCGFDQETLFPNGQTVANPQHCEFCNP